MESRSCYGESSKDSFLEIMMAKVIETNPHGGVLTDIDWDEITRESARRDRELWAWLKLQHFFRKKIEWQQIS